MRNFLKRAARPVLRSLYANDYPRLIRLGAVERPNYGYIVYQAADLARRLGIKRISALEFGVAGGRGLLNMEMHAERVRALTGVTVDVYGFDTGEGLPPPVDHRDLPNVWQEAHFRMDRAALEARLRQAKLVIGNVADTVGRFAQDFSPAPIGAISFDLDYYSSSVDAFRVFDIGHDYLLPRVFCYFDDIARRVLSPLNHLEFAYAPARLWHRQIYSFADFTHPAANTYIIGSDRQLAI